MQDSEKRHFERLLNQAEFLLQTRRFQMAIDHAMKALAIDPSSPRPCVQIAFAMARMKNSEGVDWARKAIERDPQNALLRSALSNTFTILGRWNEALPPMREALTMAPENSMVQSGMGQCLINLDRYKEAIPFLEKALELSPLNAVTHSRMSVALFELGEKNGSDRHLRRALELQPENASLHSLLGWQFRRKGKRKEAKEAFYEALRLDPRLATAKLGIGARLGSKFSLAEIFLRSALSNPQGKRLLVLRVFLALVLLFETSMAVHGVYLWMVWIVELFLLFAYYRIAKRVLKSIAHRRGIHAV